MKATISDVCDLQDRDGRHVHSKVMVLGCTFVVWVTVVLNLLWGTRPLATAEALLLGAVLLAPYGLDGLKTLLKLWRGKAQNGAGGATG